MDNEAPVSGLPGISQDGWYAAEWYFTLDSPVPGWEAWRLHGKVGRMKDGSVALIGICVDPRDDYDGPTSDQKLTAAQLRKLPLQYVLTSAATQRAYAEVGVTAESAQLQSFQNRAAGLHLAKEQRSQRAAIVGDELENLEHVAALYRTAREEPNLEGGPRKAIAEVLGVSVRTVDRLLIQARKAEVLERWDGPQGKHGKPTGEGEAK